MPLKFRLQMFLSETGATQAHVAKCTGISRTIVNYFLCDKRPLPRHWVKVLDQFLSDRGY